MIIEKTQKTIVQSHDFDSVNCTIDAEDMRYVASLLRNNYSNTRLAVIREISANALDANTEANSKRKIEIVLPSNMNPTFSVRDFGGGLSQEDVFGLYSKYGKSTKRESNNYIGAFGIGKFAPLSYGDNFTCVSYHGGKKTSYNIFVDEHDDTKIVKLHEEKSSEPTGLSIEVAVAESDISAFREDTAKFFRFFSDEEMPKFLGVEDDFINKKELALSSKNNEWFFLQDDSYHYGYGSSHIIMGRVAYPLDPQSILVENFIKDDSRKLEIIRNLLKQSNFYLRLPLGAVKLHHSREALEYNKSTQKTLVEALVKTCEEVQAIAKEKLANSEDLWEAMRNYARIVNSMPHQMRSIFENSFTWNGLQINSSSFYRGHQDHEDCIITQTDRESDKDARDGFRVRSQKTSRVHCQDNSLFLIQDIESSHGNNLRARTLFAEDSELETIFFIYPKTNAIKQRILYDDWCFDMIDEKHIRYTSQVEKQKPLRSGVRKSNGSRADIQLFEMRDKDYIYRNADYWKSVDEDISKLQGKKKSDGLVDGKFIYVPIKNYKIDIEGDAIDLDIMQKRMLFIRQHAEENSQEKSFRLFGVRSGDVSKLDSDSWVSITDFYVQFAKNYLKQNLKQAKKAYKVRLVNDDGKKHEIANLQYDIGKIFNSASLRLTEHFDNNHILCHVHDDIKSIVHNNASSVCVKLVNYLSSNHKDWLQFNLDSGFTAKQFYKDINSIKTKYPMLKYACKSVNTYGSNDKETNEDIINYIKDCDRI
jgi:hypothetical protein